jgi:hypothetical protein
VPFANGYHFLEGGEFRRSIQTSSGALLVFGSKPGLFGLVSLIAPNGAPLWNWAYRLTEQDRFPAEGLVFHDAVEASGGGYILVGDWGPRPDGTWLVVLRIDASGAMVWSRTFDVPLFRSPRILRRADSGGEVVILCDPIRTPAGYGRLAARLIPMTANGDMLGAVELDLGGVKGGRLFDGVETSAGYLFVGDAGETRTLAQWLTKDVEAELDAVGDSAFVLALNPTLGSQASWRLLDIAGGHALSARSIESRGGGVFAITGVAALGDQRRTFAINCTFGASGQLIPGHGLVYDVSAGSDRPIRIVATPTATHILDRPDATAATARVLRLDSTLQPVSLHGFSFAGATISDLSSSVDDVAVVGAIGAGADQTGVLLSLAGDLQCCKTAPLATPPPQALALNALPTPATLTPFKVLATADTAAGQALYANVLPLCGQAVDHWGDATLVQSPYLSLEAAGSMGTDAAKGVLLRWHLTGSLGQSHLPKGDAATFVLPSGFNRLADDHVILRRLDWPASPPTRKLSLATATPVHVDNVKRVIAYASGTGAQETVFHVHFPDAAAFNAASVSYNALLNPAGFISAYGVRPIEIELRGALALACDLTFQPNTGCTVRVEALSTPEVAPTATKHVTARLALGPADGPVKRIVAENLRSLHIECAGTQITELAFICYDDVLGKANQDKSWIELGRFALTTDTAEAFRRLEEPARFQVDGLWRRFNDGALVKVANYQDRWTDPDGLGAAVQTYIQLSNTDPQAVASLPGSTWQDGSISVSYLDLLNIAATDYHVARALGLGHVDAEPADAAKPYLYLIEYRTEADLGDGMGPRKVQHFYMSLPTRLSDQRLPVTPELPPVEYGISVPTGSGGAHALTDAQGYTPDGQSRYIRLYPGSALKYGEDHGFFDPPLLFDMSAISLPTCYGIEYRLQGAAGWVKPEVAHDPDYLDTAGVPEALPTPFPATQRANPFTHRETVSGVHEYAVYGIDRFFRGSGVSAAQSTDMSVFRRPNRLLPPSDLHVQLIQQESPLVLTTADEQTQLANLSGASDQTLARLCFNYGFTQDLTWDFAEAVELFFRPEMVRNVTGGVDAIGADSNPARLRIQTRPYTYASTGDVLNPVILPADKARFLGGALVAGTSRFVIEDIDWLDQVTGVNPIFVVRKPMTTGVLHTPGVGGGPGINTLVEQAAPLDLHVGDLFMAVENMALAVSWGATNPLAAVVSVGDSSWTERTESFTSDGVAVSRRLRGVWDQAKVTLVQAGVYEIAFDSYTLLPHPQAQDADPVSWWKGVVRVAVQGRDPEDRRSLKVLQVQASSTGELKLIARDDSGDAALVNENGGVSQLVNFYPGYRIYLKADAAHGFDEGTIMPAPGQGSRMGIVGGRSRDSLTTDSSGQLYDYRSDVSAPAVLAAIEIIEPGIPDRPSGLRYATPPDRYNLSSYSLTLNFQGRTPFAVTVFRADAFSILRALYAPATYDAVLAWRFPPTPDSWFNEQFADLFDFLDTPTMAAPTAFLVDGVTPLAFPYPDSPALGITGSTSAAEARALMNVAVRQAFVGLTEQPLPYALIDPANRPHNGKQIFRDESGDMLTPGAPPFDLAPMARKLGDGSVQFVDFTLSGAMNPNTVYFYFAMEIGNRMKLGERSPVWGPVALVNLAASPTPKLLRITSVLPDEVIVAGPRVEFEVMPPSATDPVSRLRIHRCLDATDALSVRTMPVVGEQLLTDLSMTAEGSLVAVDDFSEGDPPYGQPLFYRLVWVRDVPYADIDLSMKVAEAISEPTRVLLSNIVDAANPVAPTPTVSVLGVDGQGAKLLRLTWPNTVRNGTYYVCQLDESGNWFRLGEVTTAASQASFDLPFALPVTTEDGDPIWRRFKIDVMSSGGRVNAKDAPVTVDLATL